MYQRVGDGLSVPFCAGAVRRRHCLDMQHGHSKHSRRCCQSAGPGSSRQRLCRKRRRSGRVVLALNITGSCSSQRGPGFGSNPVRAEGTVGVGGGGVGGSALYRFLFSNLAEIPD